MVKLSVLLKGIILYILFIIGISILAELFNKRPRTQIDGLLDDIRRDYLTRINGGEHFTPIEYPVTRPLGMGYPSTRNHRNSQVISEEDQILNSVNAKLANSGLFGQNGDQNIQLAQTSDFSYTPISYPWNGSGSDSPNMRYPRQSEVSIDNYRYTPTTNNYGIYGTQFLPQKLGINANFYGNRN